MATPVIGAVAQTVPSHKEAATFNLWLICSNARRPGEIGPSMRKAIGFLPVTWSASVVLIPTASIAVASDSHAPR